jgi:hypothetical protein
MVRLPIIAFVLAAAVGAAPLKSLRPRGYDVNIVDQHRLLRPSSIVPFTVELVLKLEGRVPTEFYELQHAWIDYPGSSFHDFDGRTIAGLTFQQRFTRERGPGFPLAKLFAAIDEELSEGRYVVVGLRNEPDLNSFSAWVIVERNHAGEYQAVSKNGNDTVTANDVRARITRMQGTDLGIYRPANSARPASPPMKVLRPAGFDINIIHQHRQLELPSCVPSSVEMVLKLTRSVPTSYFELQQAWGNKLDGSFRDFDGRTIAGLTFSQRFTQPRGPRFPLAELFAAIDAELEQDRYVIIALRSGRVEYHNWVIVQRTADGEYTAVSKSGEETIVVYDTKARLTRIGGGDIGVYRRVVQAAPSGPYAWVIGIRTPPQVSALHSLRE